MKVLFLIRSLNVGGAQRQVTILANGLANRGHSPIITSYYNNRDMTSQLLHSVRVIQLGKQNRWDLFGFYRNLTYLVASTKPDILYSFLPTSNLLSVLIKAMFPKVKVVWGKRSGIREMDNYGLLERIILRLERHFAPFADLIIYNSKVVAYKSRSHHCPEKKARIIPNGFDVEYFKSDPEGRLRLRKEWGILPEEKLIGIVGRLDRVKDHPTFITAAMILTHLLPDLRFICVGSGDENYFREIKAMSEKLELLNRIQWIPFQSNMPAVYSALDVLVSSSNTEAFSNTIGEAMACEIPCVVTDVGDSAHILGNTGRVVPPKNPEALAEAICDLLQGLDQVDRYQIRARIQNYFSAEEVVDRTILAFQQLLKSS